MTTPRFNNTFSLGNVIQIIILIVGIAGGWFTLKADVSSLRTEQQRLAAETSDTFKDHERRMRDVERITTTQSADFRAMNSTLRDIKAQQQENNRLLRQILSREVQ